MISKKREEYWNFRFYPNSPTLKEERPILYELEKQLGSSQATTRIINVLSRNYNKDIYNIDDLKEAYKNLNLSHRSASLSKENMELIEMFIDMYRAT